MPQLSGAPMFLRSMIWYLLLVFKHTAWMKLDRRSFGNLWEHLLFNSRFVYWRSVASPDHYFFTCTRDTINH